MSGRLEIVPLDLASANEFVRQHHRHHKPVVGHKFSIGAVLDGHIVGVCIIGRPVARMRDDGWTLEVARLPATPAPLFTVQLHGQLSRSVIVESARTFSRVSRARRSRPRAGG